MYLNTTQGETIMQNVLSAIKRGLVWYLQRAGEIEALQHGIDIESH